MKLRGALPRARAAAALRTSARPASSASRLGVTRATTSPLSTQRPSGRTAPITVLRTAAAAPLPPSSLSSQGTRARRSYATEATEPLRKTALYDLHVAHGAKMVPFGGYHMPVQYGTQGVAASHHFTRSHASLFDVGHMVQHRFGGPGAAAFLQRVTPGSIAALEPHRSTLSALLWPGTGGIADDTIVTRLPSGSDGQDLFYVVTNAGCRDKDLAYLAEQLEQWAKDGGAEVRHEVLADQGLVALQGPLSAEILGAIIEGAASAEAGEASLRDLYFGQSRFLRVRGSDSPVLVSRGGYTGEDGFEISIAPGADTVAVTEALLEAGGPDKLRFAGLGARDSLRLEAGMCLYGHDLDDATTPAEAGLAWIVGRDRRGTTDPAQGAFHGAEKVLPQLTPRSKGGAGVERRRIGLVVEGAPAREGAGIVDAEGNAVGTITSGCPSPTLGRNIAMGYVRDGLHKAGTELQVSIRGRTRKAVVTKMPFVPAKYYKGTAPA